VDLLVVKALLDVGLVKLEDDLLLELDLFALHFLRERTRLHLLRTQQVLAGLGGY